VKNANRLPPMQALKIEVGKVARADFGKPRAAGGLLWGSLLNADGTPATGRMLSLSPLGGDPMSDWTGSMVGEAGEFRFEHVPAGGFHLCVEFGTTGEVAYLANIELQKDEQRRVDLQLAPGGLAGRALTSEGAPLVGARVIVMRDEEQGRNFAG